MAKVQTRRTISVVAHTYDAFKVWCEVNRVSMSAVLEELLVDLEGGPMPGPKPPRYTPPKEPRWRFEREASVESADGRVEVTPLHGQGAPRLRESVTIAWPETVAELVYDSLPPLLSPPEKRTSSPLRPLEASQALDAAIVRMLDAYSRIAERATHCAICRVRRGRVDFVPLLAGESVVAVCRACVRERRALDGRRVA